MRGDVAGEISGASKNIGLVPEEEQAHTGTPKESAKLRGRHIFSKLPL